MSPRRNLVLIGMPGCGKSTAGVLVAKALGLDFVDTDLVLQRHTGLLLHEILERVGTRGFLEAENKVLSQLKADAALISTGGSAVYHEQGMSNLRSLGTVVWMDVPFDELEHRLGDLRKRGVVLGPDQTLRSLYDERQPLYQRWADTRLEVGRENLEITVRRLAALVTPSV